MMTHVNTPVITSRKGAHAIRHIKVQDILILIDAGTILVTPAVFLSGLWQLIQPALPLGLPCHAHTFHSDLRISQLVHQILQFSIILSFLCHCCGHSSNGADFLQTLFQLFLGHLRQRIALFQQILDLLLQLFYGQLPGILLRHRGCGGCRGRGGCRGHCRRRGFRCRRSHSRHRSFRGFRRSRRLRDRTGLRRFGSFRPRSGRWLHGCFRLLCGHSAYRRCLLCSSASRLYAFLLQLSNDLVSQRYRIILCKNAD